MAKRFKEGTCLQALPRPFFLDAHQFVIKIGFVLHETFVCVVLWTAVFSAVSCMINTELVAEQGTWVAVQNSPCNTHQDRRKAYFVLGHPGIACLADFKENNFLLEAFSSCYCGFVNFITICGFFETHLR